MASHLLASSISHAGCADHKAIQENNCELHGRRGGRVSASACIFCVAFSVFPGCHSSRHLPDATLRAHKSGAPEGPLWSMRRRVSPGTINHCSFTKGVPRKPVELGSRFPVSFPFSPPSAVLFIFKETEDLLRVAKAPPRPCGLQTCHSANPNPGNSLHPLAQADILMPLVASHLEALFGSFARPGSKAIFGSIWLGNRVTAWVAVFLHWAAENKTRSISSFGGFKHYHVANLRQV